MKNVKKRWVVSKSSSLTAGPRRDTWCVEDTKDPSPISNLEVRDKAEAVRVCKLLNEIEEAHLKEDVRIKVSKKKGRDRGIQK